MTSEVSTSIYQLTVIEVVASTMVLCINVMVVLGTGEMCLVVINRDNNSAFDS